MIEQEIIETAILALAGIGEASYTDLHPNPSTMSVNEKYSIIRAHVLNIAKLQIWLDIIISTPLEECDERMFLLEDLLNQRALEASSVIMALQASVN